MIKIKSMKKVIKQLCNYVVNLIAPPYCAYCRDFLKIESVFCNSCHKKIIPVVSISLQITKTKAIKVFAVSDYKEPIKPLILAKGWSNIVASKQLGQLIWQLTYFNNIPCDVLVPIPLHWMRFSWRGYNQAYEIAKELSKKSGKPVEQLLKRTKYTAHQSKLKHDKRAENVKNIFAINGSEKNKYQDKHIVLVDDLMTTGATLRAAAKELYKLKPASINTVVACRVV